MPAAARALGLEVGRLGAPHGLAGELKIKLHAGDESALFHAKQAVAVLPTGEERTLVVDRVRPTGRGAIVRFSGVGDRDAAAELTGARVLVAREALPPLAPGEYYLADLIGVQVTGPDGPVGEVVDVVVHPSVNAVAVRLLDGKVAEQPLLPHWVGRVSVKERTLELLTLEGLIV